MALKKIRKIFYIIITLVVAGIAISSLALIIYKDRIIELLKAEIDQQIKTELAIESIDVKLLKGFPNLAIEFSSVKFYSAFENELLLESDQVYFVLNVVDLFYDKITVEQLEIRNAKLNIHKDSNGNNSFDVFTTQDRTTIKGDGLEVRSIKLLNVVIIHIDQTRNIHDEYNVNMLQGAINLIDSNYEFRVRTNIILSKTGKPYLGWLMRRHIYLDTHTNYRVGEVLNFNKSELQIDNSNFTFSGFMEFGSERRVSLSLQGESLKFTELLSLAPDKIRKKLESFETKGIIGFKALIKGNYVNNNWPGLQASFGLKNFEISNSSLEFPMKRITLDGRMDIHDLRKLETGKLYVDNFGAVVNNKEINIKGSINNFIWPQIKADVTGEIDVSWLISLGFTETQRKYGTVEGYLDVDATTSFKLERDDEKFRFEELSINGKAKLINVGVNRLVNLPLKEIDGEVLFTNDRIELIDIEGLYGGSDYNINGKVWMEESEILSSGKKLQAKLEITSDKIELDEIVEVIITLPSDSSINGLYKLSHFAIDLGLNVDTLKFKKFHGVNFKANVLANQNGIRIKQASSAGLGGEVVLTGAITKQFNGDYYIEAWTSTKLVKLDSLFYVFNNFNQDFITTSAVKGKLNADIYTHMYFNDKWSLHRNLLYAEALLQVQDGELNDFEPVMSLSSYLKNEEENLSKLRFSDLESRIVISDDTVYISDMYIGSNVRNIKVGGYHTLDQAIDYRLSVPISGKNRDRDETFGEVKKDKNGKLFMPFKIEGTTTDYKVSYDLKKASSNFVKGFKNELLGIGNSRKSDSLIEENRDSLLLDDDEFFDWDDN